MRMREYNAESVVGKKYERGLLPYGGCVNSSGKITFALGKKEFEREITESYVRKDDYRIDIAEIKGMFNRIMDKLDTKVDK